MFVLLLTSMWPSGSPAQAEWRPSRNVEIIVQVTAEGSSDRTARMIQRMLHDRQLVETTTAVVNRPGGGGAVAFNYLTQHASDGHYWLIGSVALLTSYASG